MGGRSHSTFKVEGGLGIFAGEVAIVPSLKAPGFCNSFVKIPSADASACEPTHAPASQPASRTLYVRCPIAHARRLILDFGRQITAHARVFIALQDRLRALPP